MALPYPVFDLTIERAPRLKPILTDELKRDFTASAKTSIFRSGPSAPMKVLLEKKLIPAGSCINYGKGKFSHDTDAIASVSGHCVEYDFIYHPDAKLLGSSYDTLYAGYVVNVLPPVAREYVWLQMSNCTRGVAFIAARTDHIKGTDFEDGVYTSIKTFQKSYGKGALLKEALKYFEYAVEIKGKTGFSIVACSHTYLPERVINHAK
jgi:hypothetical protein